MLPRQPPRRRVEPRRPLQGGQRAAGGDRTSHREVRGSDPELRAIIASLRERYVVYEQVMAPALSKSEHYASMNVAKLRDGTGKARRRPTP